MNTMMPMMYKEQNDARVKELQAEARKQQQAQVLRAELQPEPLEQTVTAAEPQVAAPEQRRRNDDHTVIARAYNLLAASYHS